MRSLLAASVAVAVVAPAIATAQLQPRTLTELRDQARPLLLFAEPADLRLAEQLRALQDGQTSLRERDVAVVLISPAAPPTSDGALPVLRFSAVEQSALRKRFHIVPGQFTAVLVGKDGGEKLRSSSPVTVESLCRKIDTMPMRKEEMRRR